MDYKKEYENYKTKYLQLKKEMNINEIESKIKLLKESSDKSFVLANIGLSDDEKQLVDDIKIIYHENTKNNMSYMGKFNADIIATQIQEFLEQLGNDNEKSKLIVNILINKIIKQYLIGNQSDSLWFTIRTYDRATASYIIPRWHTDGNFYKPNEIDPYQLKLAGVFKGPATLFKKYNSELQTKFKSLYKELYSNFDYKDREKDISNRKILDNEFKNYEQTSSKFDQVVIFIVGSETRSAIHSEPNIDRERFFFSVVAGNEEQIRELALRSNQVYIDTINKTN